MLLPFNQSDDLNRTRSSRNNAPLSDSQESNDLPTIGPHITLPPPSPGSKPRLHTSKVVFHTTKGEIVFLLLKSSALWVAAGIGTMVIGIGIVEAVLFPKIHTCPSDALCPGSFNPNATNVLQLLQSLMSYWLQAGMIIAGIGLLKLSAFQSWFIMMERGNTIHNLDLNLGAIKGSLLDACQLLLRKGNRVLSFLVLMNIGISAAVSLIVGLSIARTGGEKSLTFSFASISRFPNSDSASLNSDGQLNAISKVTGWALTNDTSHGSALWGTLVYPDGRSNQTVNAFPGGPRIRGNISCAGFDNYTIVTGSPVQYDIFLGGKTYSALPDMHLAVSETGLGTAFTHYLWVSNSTGVVPNASATSDGRMNIALCNHTIFMENVTQPTTGDLQTIDPNLPLVSGCASDNRYVCVSDSVNNAILTWWGSVGTAFWKLSCRGGVMGPLKPDDTLCPLNPELWSETVTSMLDGIMQTAPRSENSTQELVARVETLGKGRWWLQGIVPLSTLLLYILALTYTVYLSQGSATLKELNLAEVIEAAQTDHVRNLVNAGQFKKSIFRYGSGVGFFRDS